MSEFAVSKLTGKPVPWEADPSPPKSKDDDPPPPPPEPDKTVHNEVTKLKATTLNTVGIAFFVGGGVAPLISWVTAGLTLVQALLGVVWVFTGFVLHSLARRVLTGLIP